MIGARILIYGPSGGGKSSSNRNLNHLRTGYINADRKDLPFYNWPEFYKTVLKEGTKIPDYVKSNYVKPKKTASVMEAFEEWEKRSDIDNIVLDTITHMMAHDFMRRILEPGYVKYSQMGLNVYDILDYIRSSESKKNFIVLAHNELGIDAAGDKQNKIRSFGKLMDEKVEIPSMFTTVMYASGRQADGKTRFVFQTQTDGTNYAKTPVMFKGDEVINALPPEMANDTQKVIDRLKLFKEGKMDELIALDAPPETAV